MKRTRKQPRRLTPPLMLRNIDTGERECIEVDQDHVTTAAMISGRVRAILQVSPGLRIELGSRCINKVRVPVVRIATPDYNPREASPTCRDCGSNIELHGHAPDCENLPSYQWPSEDLIECQHLQEGGE